MERKVERNKAGQQSITYSGYEKSKNAAHANGWHFICFLGCYTLTLHVFSAYQTVTYQKVTYQKVSCKRLRFLRPFIIILYFHFFY